MGRISDFADQYTSMSTRTSYTTSVCVFLAMIYQVNREPKITRDLLGRYEDFADRYFSEERDYSKDLIRFASSMAGRPPKTARQYLSAVKEWLVFHDVEISERDLRKVRQRTPKGGAVTIQRDLEIEGLRSLLAHLDLKMRALVLLLASSGMRIGEALALTLDDVVLEKDAIGSITIRAEGAKTRQQRYTFCSPEAANEVLEWMKKRDQYLQAAEGRGAGLGIVKAGRDNRLFPFTDNVVYAAWERALRAADLHSRDRKTNRIQINIHLLRAFFTSQLKLAVPGDVVELLAGHRGYLSDAYRRYSRKQVQDLYRKGVPYVTVMIPADVRELQTTTQDRLQAHTDLIESLVQRTLSQEKQIKELQDLSRAYHELVKAQRDSRE